jgi:hypothetical protein
MHGTFGDVIQNISDSHARNQALTKFARAEQAIATARRDLEKREATLTSRQVENFAAQCDALTSRLDALEQRRADRKRRDQEEMEARATEYIADLPDPEQGELSQGDDIQPGSSELVAHPPVDDAHLGITDTDGATGSLPRQLDPPDLDKPEPEHLAQPPKSPQHPQPTSISLW